MRLGLCLGLHLGLRMTLYLDGSLNLNLRLRLGSLCMRPRLTLDLWLSTWGG